MDKNPLGEGRTLPMDTESLQAMLANGPSAPQSEAKPQVPPMPEARPPEKSEETVEKPSIPAVDEGPDEELKAKMILPTEEEKSHLKAKHGFLRVVPMPYAREDQKVQTYILRQLNRSQWRAMEEASRKIAEAKPGLSLDSIFQEKIVTLALVWPNIQEYEIAAHPAGLVPTLFGVVQQMGLFFDPEALMRLTFVL